ncbi:MAG TPA: hypothetical protein VII86_00230, partial [Thermoanaerobaculia bacterium]
KILYLIVRKHQRVLDLPEKTRVVEINVGDRYRVTQQRQRLQVEWGAPLALSLGRKLPGFGDIDGRPLHAKMVHRPKGQVAAAETAAQAHPYRPVM